MKSVPLSVELQSLNYWTTREVPGQLTLRFPGFYFDLSFTSYSVPLWLRPGGSVLRVHGADLLFRTHYRLSCTHFFGLGKISSFSCRSLMDMQHFPMNTYWLFWQLSFSFKGANSMPLLWLLAFVSILLFEICGDILSHNFRSNVVCGFLTLLYYMVLWDRIQECEKKTIPLTINFQEFFLPNLTVKKKSVSIMMLSIELRYISMYNLIIK